MGFSGWRHPVWQVEEFGSLSGEWPTGRRPRGPWLWGGRRGATGLSACCPGAWWDLVPAQGPRAPSPAGPVSESQGCRARGKQSCCFLFAVCYLGGLPERFSSVRFFFFFLMKSFPGSCRNAMSRALRVTRDGPGLHPVSGLHSHICAPAGEARPLPRLGLHGPQ